MSESICSTLSPLNSTTMTPWQAVLRTSPETSVFSDAYYQIKPALLFYVQTRQTALVKTKSLSKQYADLMVWVFLFLLIGSIVIPVAKIFLQGKFFIYDFVFFFIAILIL